MEVGTDGEALRALRARATTKRCDQAGHIFWTYLGPRQTRNTAEHFLGPNPTALRDTPSLRSAPRGSTIAY